MKAWPVIAAIAAVSAIVGWARQSRLAELEQENVRLGKEASAAHSPRLARSERPAPPSSAELAEIRSQARWLASRLIDPSKAREDRGEGPRVSLAFGERISRLDQRTILRLVEETVEEMGLQDKGPVITTYGWALMEWAAAKALQLLVDLPLYDGRNDLIRRAYQRTAVKDPSLVVRCFERQDEAGDPAARDLFILRTVFAAQARIDPALAIDRLLSPKGIELMADIRQMPDIFSAEFRTPAEHGAFLAALRRAPNTERRRILSDGYMQELRMEMSGWPFDEAKPLIDAEFSPEEQQRYALLIWVKGVPEEPGRYADWVMGMAWQDRLNHPIDNFIRSWSNHDPIGARRWLESLPAGAVRDSAVENYALDRSAKAPDDATEVAMMLAAGRNRDRILKIIRNQRNKQADVRPAR